MLEIPSIVPAVNLAVEGQDKTDGAHEEKILFIAELQTGKKISTLLLYSLQREARACFTFPLERR